MEWAIEVCKETGKTVAASMCIGPEGDLHGTSAGECAVRMAKAGASVGKPFQEASFYAFNGQTSSINYCSAMGVVVTCGYRRS